MTDKLSIEAVDVAILFGQGKASREELDTAAGAYAASYAAAAAAAASYAAHAYAVYAAGVREKNQQETADICRRILTEDVLAAINNL